MTDETPPWEDEDRLRDFAREFARRGDARQAAITARAVNPAYGAAIWAEKLLKRADVQAYVREASEAGQARMKMPTRETIAVDLEEVFERALAAEAFAPAVTAKKTQAEVLGLMEKNVRVTFGHDVKELSMEDLERELARLQSEGVVALLPSGVSEDGVEVYE